MINVNSSAFYVTWNFIKGPLVLKDHFFPLPWVVSTDVLL